MALLQQGAGPEHLEMQEKAWDQPVSERTRLQSPLKKTKTCETKTKRLDGRDGERIGEASHPGPGPSSRTEMHQAVEVWMRRNRTYPHCQALSALERQSDDVMQLILFTIPTRTWGRFTLLEACSCTLYLGCLKASTRVSRSDNFPRRVLTDQLLANLEPRDQGGHQGKRIGEASHPGPPGLSRPKAGKLMTQETCNCPTPLPAHICTVCTTSFTDVNSQTLACCGRLAHDTCFTLHSLCGMCQVQAIPKTIAPLASTKRSRDQSVAQNTANTIIKQMRAASDTTTQQRGQKELWETYGEIIQTIQEQPVASRTRSIDPQVTARLITEQVMTTIEQSDQTGIWEAYSEILQVTDEQPVANRTRSVDPQIAASLAAEQVMTGMGGRAGERIGEWGGFAPWT